MKTIGKFGSENGRVTGPAGCLRRRAAVVERVEIGEPPSKVRHANRAVLMFR